MTQWVTDGRKLIVSWYSSVVMEKIGFCLNLLFQLQVFWKTRFCKLLLCILLVQQMKNLFCSTILVLQQLCLCLSDLWFSTEVRVGSRIKFEACICQRVLQSLCSRESQLDEKGNVFSMNAEWMWCLYEIYSTFSSLSTLRVFCENICKIPAKWENKKCIAGQRSKLEQRALFIQPEQLLGAVLLQNLVLKTRLFRSRHFSSAMLPHSETVFPFSLLPTLIFPDISLPCPKFLISVGWSEITDFIL